jgi:hypothetical protein
MSNKSRKNKRNACFPRTFSLASAAQKNSDNMNDNADDYFLIVSRKLLDCACFTDKQQLDTLLNITICIFRYQFPVALGMSSTWKL